MNNPSKGGTSGVARDAETIIEVLEQFERVGYTSQLAARDGARIECFACRNTSPAGTFSVGELHRLEGVSDPADMIAIAALVCPRCATPGTLILNYGPEAIGADAEVLAALERTPPPPAAPSA